MKTIKLEAMPTSLFDDELRGLDDYDLAIEGGGGFIGICWSGLADGGVLLGVEITASGEYEEWDDDALIEEAEQLVKDECCW